MIYAYHKNELYHHGILGQEWGERNGPPYPLDADDHSKSEKKAGWRKSVSGMLGKIAKNKKAKQTNVQKTKNRLRTNLDNFNKDAKNKNIKIAKKDLNKHRESMASYWEKRGDKETADIYRKASDEEIQADLKHKRDLQKKIALGVAAVGTTAAIAIILRHNYLNALRSANLAKNINKQTNEELINNLGLESAKKIFEVSNKDRLMRFDETQKLLDAVNNDVNVCLKAGTKLARVDGFSKEDISKLENTVFASISRSDNEIYKDLPIPGVLNQGGKAYNHFLEAAKDINVPSNKELDDIIEDLYKNPKFRAQAIKGVENMLAGRIGNAAAKLQAETTYEALKNRHGGSYIAVTALGGKNKEFNDMFTDALNKRGFNAVLDIHDMVDGVSKTPIIVLDNDALTVTGSEYVGKWRQSSLFGWILDRA